MLGFMKPDSKSLKQPLATVQAAVCLTSTPQNCERVSYRATAPSRRPQTMLCPLTLTKCLRHWWTRANKTQILAFQIPDHQTDTSLR